MLYRNAYINLLQIYFNALNVASLVNPLHAVFLNVVSIVLLYFCPTTCSTKLHLVNNLQIDDRPLMHLAQADKLPSLGRNVVDKTW